MVIAGCGRQIKKGEHYFYREHSKEEWIPFISDFFAIFER